MSRKGEVINCLPIPEQIHIKFPEHIEQSELIDVYEISKLLNKKLESYPLKKPGCRRRIRTLKGENGYVDWEKQEIVYEIYYVTNTVFGGNGNGY